MVNEKSLQIERGSIPATILGNVITTQAIPMFAELDKVFQIDENCNGCGICEKVCPRGNLRMKDSVPTWNHKCEQCFACIHWCPQKALQMGEETKGKPRYHHPEVSLKEMIHS